jgi:hypothetical protein
VGASPAPARWPNGPGSRQPKGSPSRRRGGVSEPRASPRSVGAVPATRFPPRLVGEGNKGGTARRASRPLAPFGRGVLVFARPRGESKKIMYYPTLAQAKALAAQGNLLPVYREVAGDLETPVSAYLKVARGDHSFLLESVEGGERLARYSFIATEPYRVARLGPTSDGAGRARRTRWRNWALPAGRHHGLPPPAAALALSAPGAPPLRTARAPGGDRRVGPWRPSSCSERCGNHLRHTLVVLTAPGRRHRPPTARPPGASTAGGAADPLPASPASNPVLADQGALQHEPR